MKQLTMMVGVVALLLAGTLARAVDRTTEDVRIPSLGIRGTATLIGTTTITMALTNATTGKAALSGTTGVMTFTDLTTAAIKLAVNNGSAATTGTLTGIGGGGTYSFGAAPAAATFLAQFATRNGYRFAEAIFTTNDAGASSGTMRIDGTVKSVRFVNGPPAPTSLWDCSIKSDGLTVIETKGDNISTATLAVQTALTAAYPTRGDHVVIISNGGARKSGKAVVFYE